jgi:hypothetical protein
MNQLRSETEQLKNENAKLRKLNARGKTLLSSAAQLCSQQGFSSTPPNPTVPD